MNRIVYSCLLLFTFIFTQHIKAQVFNFNTTSAVLCYTGSGAYTVGAVQTASSAGATNYSFIVSSSVPTAQASWTMAPGNGSACVITFTQCGTYTITHYAYNVPPPAIPINNAQQVFTVVCPSSGTIGASASTVCLGAAASLTANGAASYTWFAQTGTTTPVNIGTGAVMNVTPTAQTSYSFVGTTAAGCTVNSPVKIIYVQKATFTASPVSLTVCPGAPINLTSTTQVTNGGNFTSGTASTQVQWFNPANTQIGSLANITTTASAGIYTAIVTHTGAAGTCTLSSTVNVNTLSTIPVTISANAASVCPGAGVILNAGVTATPAAASASITWISQAGASPTVGFSGSPVTRNPTAPTSYTVNINYYGCTGSNTIAVGISTITPTLTASSPSSCPGKSITLTATGGISYTMTAYYANNPGFAVGIPTLSPGNIGVISPSANQLGPSFAPTASVVLLALANGCTGTSTITIGKLTLNTQLVANSPSVCPNTQLCLQTTNGCNTTNTITFLTYSTTGTSTNCSTTASAVCFNSGLATFFPLTFTVVSDSAGCKGSANLTVYKRDMVTNITPSSYSICPETAVSFTASNGSGTNYTWTAPYTAPNSTVSSVFYTGLNSTVSVNTQSNPILPYTYTVEADSAGCKGSSQITIGKLILTPTLTASSASICPGSSFTLTSSGSASSSYTFDADYVVTTPTSVTLPNVGNVATGTVPNNSLLFPHTFSLVTDSAGCIGTASVQIGLLNLTSGINLSAFNAYSTNSVTPTNSMCPGQNFTLVATNTNTSLAGATGYTFFALPSTIIPNTTSNTAVTSLNAASFPMTYIVYADNSGCVGSQTLTVGRLYINNLILAATPSVVCAGMPSTLIAISSGTAVMAPGVTYQFAAASPSGTPVQTATPFYVVNPLVPTTYTMTMDSLGCTTSTPGSILIGITPSLALTPSATNYSVCAGLPTTLSVISGTVPSVTYTWTSNSGTLNVGSSPSASAVALPTVATQYTIDASDPLGCVGSTVLTIGIDPNASLSMSISCANNTICPSVTTALTASCSLNPVTFSWSPAPGLTTVPGTDTIVTISTAVNAVNFAVYTATANNGWGCTGSASYTVNLVPIPTPTIVPTSQNVCVGYTSTLTASGANSYTWTSPNFTNSVAQPSLSVGAGTYSVLGSNGGGCTAIAAININTMAPLVIIPVASTPTTCIENNSPKYSKPVILTAGGAQNYVWFPYNPTHMTYSLGPTTTVRPPATTIYTVTGSTQVCAGSGTIMVVVIPQFSMNVVPPLPYMCLGDSLKLSITGIGPSSLVVGPASAYSYSWTEAQNAPPISMTSKFTPTVLVYPQNTTTYSTEVRDSRSCVSLPRLVTVTVLPRPISAIAIPTINNVATNTVCYVGLNPGPDDVVLTLTGTNKNTNLQFGVVPTYTWVSPYDSKHNSILTPVNNNAVTISAPLKLPSVVVYTLLSGYNGVQGCVTKDTVSVRVIDCRPVTAVSFTTAERIDTICVRNCITFINTTDTAAGGPQNILWTFKGGNPATSTSSIVTVCYNLPSPDKGYDVILSVTNPYPKSPPNGQPSGSGNSYGAPGYVKVYDIPNVTIVSPGQLRSDTTVRIGTPITVNGSGALTYSWSPNYNITSLTSASVTLNPFRSTQYILTGRNSKNCYSSDTLNVIVIEDCGEMYVPNAFTPNDDGVNDVLYVRGICLKTLTFMVFNRWGEKVFETADQRIGWNGTYKGEDLNSGVFVFRLEGKTYDGKVFSTKGNITLMR